MRTGPRTGLLAATLALAAAAPAAAENGYEAKWVGQSPYLTLESGETATSWFDAQNVGSATWTNDVVRLGTTNPRDRGSAFADGSWINVARPTPLDPPFVEPGNVGRFTFTVRAPDVSGTTSFYEFFAPVAEYRGWMENDASNWPTNGVYLVYTVLPGEPPRVSIASAPERVPQGTPVAVRASASDNRSVARVEFRLGQRPVVRDRAWPFQKTIDTTGMRSGTYRLAARAVDRTGRTTTVARFVTLDPVPNGAGASRGARMIAGFGKKRRQARRTIRFGRATYIRGRLTNETGAPITGAVIRVWNRVLTGNRGFSELPPISTGQDGGFAFRAARGPSRQFRFTYTPFAEDAQPAALKIIGLKTRAGVRMRANQRRVAPGGRVAFRGRLRGGHLPRRGVLVVLQGHQRGFGWRTFKTVRAGTRGRFKGSYRFVRSAGRFRFRAVVRAQPAYPWATGRSRPVTVRVG